MKNSKINPTTIMKTISKSISLIAALLLLVVFAPVSAENITNHTISAKDVLKGDAVNKLESFFSDYKSSVIKSKSWTIFKSVVKFYNEDKVAFNNMTSKEQYAFNKAVASLNNKLTGFKSEEADNWAVVLNETALAINRTWNFDVKSILPVDELEEVHVQIGSKSTFDAKSILPNNEYNENEFVVIQSNSTTWFNAENFLPKLTDADSQTEVESLQVKNVTWFDVTTILPNVSSDDTDNN